MYTMFELKKLPYAYDALEPYIDAQTMETHYTKHHQWYTDKLNTAIQWTEWEQRTIEEILTHLDALPADKKDAITNNGGGYYNHNIFRSVMTPNGSAIPSDFAEKLTASFGSIEDFKEQFSSSAVGNFWSGWTWLVKDASWILSIVNTKNQGNPISQGLTPILGIDVWEHAYYLKYQNRRPEYIQQRWNVVHWEQVAENYQK